MGIISLLKRRRRKRQARTDTRGYSAAMTSRLTADWVMDSGSATALLRSSLRLMRARARDLERNNDYARGVLSSLAVNIAGPAGVKVQMQAKNSDGSPDAAANAIIETAFARWSERGVATMDGRMSWAEAQRMIVRTVARDGEVLVRLVRGRQAGNDFGFAIQILEGDHMDEADDRDLYGGRKVRSGVEMNAWGRPEAYHILRDHPGDAVFSAAAGRKLRIPASSMLHVYIPDRPGQVRGASWLASAILRLRQLGKYEEAELVAARVAAAKMGFFEPDPDADPALIGARDAHGDLITEAEPGQFEVLPNGYRFRSWDPQHPNAAFDAFQKAMLRGVSAALGMSYASVSGDLSQTNYSSLRQGALMERDVYRTIQDWLIAALVKPVFMSWLEMAMTTGEVNLPMAKFEKFAAPSFRPRGWAWVDPLKEMAAHEKALALMLETHSGLAASAGGDFADIVARRKADEATAAAAGLDLPVPPLRRGAGAQKQGGNDDEKT